MPDTDKFETFLASIRGVDAGCFRSALIDVADTSRACVLWFESQGLKTPAFADVLAMARLVLEREAHLKGREGKLAWLEREMATGAGEAQDLGADPEAGSVPDSTSHAAFVGSAVLQLVDLLDRYHRSREQNDPQGGWQQPLDLTLRPVHLSQSLVADWIEREIKETARDPARATLKSRAREIGYQLHSLGGTDLMHEAYDKVASARGRPSVALDRWWSGIGANTASGRGVWVA